MSSPDEKIGNAIVVLGCMMVGGVLIAVGLLATIIRVWTH